MGIDSELSVLVVGCGSIGQRHIANLQALGVPDITAMDIRLDRRQIVSTKYNIPAVESMDQGLGGYPKVAIIATPPTLHTSVALEAAEAGCNLFIEKPISDRIDGLEELITTAHSQEIKTLVGCNMRFHHGPATIKKLLAQRAVGNVTAAIMDAGQYLPDWHPLEDYRDLYSSHSSMGGGVILDGIHEIDYARWLFGDAIQVYCQGGKLSSLDIDTEDSVNILMKTKTNISVSIHLDYLQRAYSRTCKVIGEEGTIVWDINRGDVEHYSANTNQWTYYAPVHGYTINQMYVDEMAYFLSSLNSDQPINFDLTEGKRVLEIALAIKQSMFTGEPIKVSN